MLQPYMPDTSHTIQQQLQAPSECNVLLTQFIPYLGEGHIIGEVMRTHFHGNCVLIYTIDVGSTVSRVCGSEAYEYEQYVLI